ncbi:MAG: hypothetical protein A2202_08130 [Bdellovibrionales bacterium RIFOXYA1_FULL_36_14]|nr:MAG: hypothetical protein A2202_08130 [Bdellovibrionales bacterium RIFOXYA1_FULL_36_14]
MSKLDLKIVMPVYNEELNIEKVIVDWITELRKLKISFQLFAYNDGSKDATREKLEQLKLKHSELIAIHKENSGHGPTLLTGYQDRTPTEWIFQVDSDDEMSPEYFHLLWNERKNYDFLIGYRTNRHSPLPRKIISFISRFTVTLLYGGSVYDVNSPYRLFKAEFFDKLITKIPSDTFAPNVILSGLASHYHARCKSFDIPHSDRKLGEVSIKKWKLLKAAMKSFYQTILYRFTLD